MKPRTRLAVLDRDEWTCQVCGGPGQEIDHKIPRRMGGRYGEAKKRIEAMENLRTICIDCHRRKHG